MKGDDERRWLLRSDSAIARLQLRASEPQLLHVQVVLKGTLKPVLHSPILKPATAIQEAGENSLIFLGVGEGSVVTSFRLNLGSGEARARFMGYVKAVLEGEKPKSNSRDRKDVVVETKE